MPEWLAGLLIIGFFAISAVWALVSGKARTGYGMVIQHHHEHGAADTERAALVRPVRAGAALLRSAHTLLSAHAMSPLEPSSTFTRGHRHAQRQRRTMALGLLSPEPQHG